MVASVIRKSRPPAKPSKALFVDMWPFYRGCAMGTPTGIANFTTLTGGTAGNGNLTVSGSAGSNTLTYSAVNEGVEADYAATWGAVVEYDDGSYGVHTASAIDTTANTITVTPTLDGDVTNKQFGNIQDAVNGQHLTLLGSQALAKYIHDQVKRYCYIDRFIDRRISNLGTTMLGTAWTLIPGSTTGTLSGTSIQAGIANQVANMDSMISGATLYSGADRSTSIHGDVASTVLAVNTAGHGMTRTVSLGGATGYVDFILVVAGQFSTTEASPARVEIVVDGVTVVDRTVTTMERVKAPFDNASSLTVRITANATTTASVYRISRFGVYRWTRDTANIDEALLPTGARVGLLMDSWGTRSNNAIAAKLVELDPTMTTTNGSVGGMTATWGLQNMDRVLSGNPEYVLTNFQINDANVQGSQAGATTWFRNIRSLLQAFSERGVTPIFLRSEVCSSFAQTQSLSQFDCDLLSYYPRP